MSNKSNKKDKYKVLEGIVLVTAVLNLIDSVIELVTKLIH